MANDRILLVCKKCQRHYVFAKFWGDCVDLPETNSNRGQLRSASGHEAPDPIPLQQFVDAHLFNCQEREGMSLGQDPGFELRTEAVAEKVGEYERGLRAAADAVRAQVYNVSAEPATCLEAIEQLIKETKE